MIWAHRGASLGPSSFDLERPWPTFRPVRPTFSARRPSGASPTLVTLRFIERVWDSTSRNGVQRRVGCGRLRLQIQIRCNLMVRRETLFATQRSERSLFYHRSPVLLHSSSTDGSRKWYVYVKIGLLIPRSPPVGSVSLHCGSFGHVWPNPLSYRSNFTTADTTVKINNVRLWAE